MKKNIVLFITILVFLVSCSSEKTMSLYSRSEFVKKAESLEYAKKCIDNKSYVNDTDNRYISSRCQLEYREGYNIYFNYDEYKNNSDLEKQYNFLFDDEVRNKYILETIKDKENYKITSYKDNDSILLITYDNTMVRFYYNVQQKQDLNDLLKNMGYNFTVK